jgi:hypothetical protein
MKLFDNTELKLAILYCLEKTGSKNLWKEVKKVTQKPSFFHYVYLVCQIKKSGLYPHMKLQIKIKRSNKFYNMLFKHILKYDYKIETCSLKNDVFLPGSKDSSLKNEVFLPGSKDSSLKNEVFLPITNEKLSQVIKRWKISKKLIKKFKQKYNLNGEKHNLKQKLKPEKISNDTYNDYLLTYTLAFIFITYLQIILLYFVSF